MSLFPTNISTNVSRNNWYQDIQESCMNGMIRYVLHIVHALSGCRYTSLSRYLPCIRTTSWEALKSERPQSTAQAISSTTSFLKKQPFRPQPSDNNKKKPKKTENSVQSDLREIADRIPRGYELITSKVVLTLPTSDCVWHHVDERDSDWTSICALSVVDTAGCHLRAHHSLHQQCARWYGTLCIPTWL